MSRKVVIKVHFFSSLEEREKGEPILESTEVRSLAELDDLVTEYEGKGRFLSFHKGRIRLVLSAARYQLEQYGEQLGK